VTTVASAHAPDFASREPSHHLGLWLAASLLLHAVVIVSLVNLLPQIPLAARNQLGVATPIQIAIVTAAPVPVAPPPEALPPVIETPPPLPRLEDTVPMPPAPSLKPPPNVAPAPVAPVKPVVPMAPLGVFVQADTNGETAANDMPPPPGDIAVGAVQNADRVGSTQALRLAQKYDTQVSNPPRLRGPLTVAYPPGPARAHLEARIAVLITVDDAGNIGEISLYPDEAQFGPAIRTALQSARMAPGDIRGAPIAYWTILEFVFTMRQPAAAPVARQ
jgi:outer membrane biosynthesis protein TonB